MYVTLTHYEDSGNNSSGEIVTVYWVNVQYSTHKSYSLSKRYSDFATLYQVLKDYLPNDYKFPNKSLFHNNAQFTKERRMKGFDELLKYLSRHVPLNPDFQAFLEIKTHISAPEREEIIEQMKTQSLENTPADSALNTPIPGSSSVSRRALIRSISLKSKMSTQSETPEETTIRRKLSQLSNFLLGQSTDPEENLTLYEIMMKEKAVNFRYQFHQNIAKHLKTAMKTSSVIYVVIILLGIIDLSYISYSRTFYLFTSLVMIFLFFEVKKIRFQITRQEKQGNKYNDKRDNENNNHFEDNEHDDNVMSPTGNNSKEENLNYSDSSGYSSPADICEKRRLISTTKFQQKQNFLDLDEEEDIITTTLLQDRSVNTNGANGPVRRKQVRISE
jgi:hypothetical protein